MKKIIITALLFMATSVWSADYQICTGNAEDTRKCVMGYMAMGYEPLGGIAGQGNSSYYYAQAMILKD